MGKKIYQHPFAVPKETQICFRCTKAHKHKLDEVVTYLHKSKTEIMLSHIDELYKKMIEK